MLLLCSACNIRRSFGLPSRGQTQAFLDRVVMIEFLGYADKLPGSLSGSDPNEHTRDKMEVLWGN